MSYSVSVLTRLLADEAINTSNGATNQGQFRFNKLRFFRAQAVGTKTQRERDYIEALAFFERYLERNAGVPTAAHRHR